MSNQRFYDEPRYYDIAFGWDITREADFVEQVFKQVGSAEVHAVLDLACGTGRFALELARRGYEAAGLDVSREMVAYARERAAGLGLPVELFLKDMTDFSLFRTFDAALCMTGSFEYLCPLDNILKHLRAVAAHLNPSGLYLVDLGVVMGFGDQPFPPQEWTAERDHVRVKARWELPGPYDALLQTTKEKLTLRGEERGWERVWEQESTVRLFWPQEFLAVVEASGCFRLAGWYRDFDLEAKFDTPPYGRRMLAVLVKAAKPVEPSRAAEDAPVEGGFERGRRPGGGGRGPGGRGGGGRGGGGRGGGGREGGHGGGGRGDDRREGHGGAGGGAAGAAGTGEPVSAAEPGSPAVGQAEPAPGQAGPVPGEAGAAPRQAGPAAGQGGSAPGSGGGPRRHRPRRRHGRRPGSAPEGNAPAREDAGAGPRDEEPGGPTPPAEPRGPEEPQGPGSDE